MKKIRELDTPTPGLAKYLDSADPMRIGTNSATTMLAHPTANSLKSWLMFSTDCAATARCDPDDSDMDAWMRSLLMPDDAGRLVPFFTTARSYFGPLAERVLKQQPQGWI